MNSRDESENPLRRVEDWEDFGEARYPAPAGKPREDCHNYDNPARDTVRDFFRLNHQNLFQLSLLLKRAVVRWYDRTLPERLDRRRGAGATRAVAFIIPSTCPVLERRTE